MNTRRGRTRDNRRRGLRILLWVLCLFWLAQLMGGLVLDYLWVRPRYPARADMVARLKARKTAPQIVFLGSSRFGGDVHEATLDAVLRRHLGERAPRTFNASLPAGDPTVFERVVEDMFSDGFRPRLLVVEVDPATLAGRDNWLYQHALNVLEWRDVPEAAPALCKNARILYLVRGRLLALYLHRYHICKEAFALVTSGFRSPSNFGVYDPPVPPSLDHDPKPPVQTPQVLAAIERGYPENARELRNYRVGGVVTRRLERLLDRCRSAGVKVVLTGVPVSSSSRRAVTPEIDAEFLASMNQLADRYGCSFVDWREHVPDAYFVDMHHTSPEGGVYFSRRFAASVLVPLWRELGQYPASAAARITADAPRQ